MKQPYWLIFSQLHKRIAVHFSTLLRQIQPRISNHPGIERQSKRYRVDVSYPETRLAYSRLTRIVQPSISLLRNKVQAHLRSTILSSLMVSDLTPHAYSIHRPILTSRHSLLSYAPTPRRASEPFTFCSIQSIFSSFLNALNLCLPAHTENHLSETIILGAGAAHPSRLKLISESMLDWYVRAPLKCHKCHAPCQTIPWRKVSTTHLP
jgi:hypothetical protein